MKTAPEQQSSPARRIFQAARAAIRRSSSETPTENQISLASQTVLTPRNMTTSMTMGRASNGGDEADEETQRKQQEGLEEASRVCAQGRQDWTENKPEEALAKFEKALRVLEGLLGTYHALTAKTYYWLGFIRKHDESTYALALQDFLQTARIRLVLLGPSHDSTQEAIAAISWVLHSQGGHTANSIKDYLKRLHESIRQETLGDARLRHRNYQQAISYYKQAMETFEDPNHATIMGKRAFCSFQAGQVVLESVDERTTFKSGLPLSWALLRAPQPPESKNQSYLDEATGWYRQALLILCNETVHGRDHPDLPTTQERMGQALKAYQENHGAVYEAAAVETYLARDIFVSTEAQHRGLRLLIEQNSTTSLEQAIKNLSEASEVEQNFLGSNHPIPIYLHNLIQEAKTKLSNLRNVAGVSPVSPSARKLSFRSSSQSGGSTKSKSLVKIPKETSESPIRPARVVTIAAPAAAGEMKSDSDWRAVVETLQVQVSTLATDQESWLVEKQKLVSRLQTLENERNELQTQNEHSRLDILELQGHWEQAKAAEADLKAQLVVDQSKLEIITQNRHSEVEASVAQLRHKVGSLELELAQSQDQVLASQQTTAILHTKLTTQEELVDKWKSKVQAQEALLIETQEALDSQTEQVQTYQHQAKEASNQPPDSSAEVELHRTKQTLQEVESQLQAVQAKAASLELVNQFSEQKLEDYKAQHSNLVQQLAEREQKVVRLQGKLEEVVSAADKPSSESQNSASVVHKSALDSLKMTLQYERELQNSEQEIQSLQEQLRNLRDRKQSSDDQVSSLETEKAEVEESLQKLQSEFTRVKSKNQRLESDLKKLKVVLQQLHPKKRGSSIDEVSLVASSSADTTDSQLTDQAVRWDLRRSLALTPWKFHSIHADYSIRRPLTGQNQSTTKEEREIFSAGEPLVSSQAYLQGAHVNNSLTLDVVARVAADGSSVYVLGNGQVYHRFADGSWGVRGRSTLDIDLDEPLGWISSVGGKNGHDQISYSLDAIVEEAQIFRHQYSQMVLYQAAHLIANGNTLGCIPAYVGYQAEQSRKVGPTHNLFDLPTLLLVAALIVGAIAIVLAHYKVSI